MIRNILSGEKIREITSNIRDMVREKKPYALDICKERIEKGIISYIFCYSSS